MIADTNPEAGRIPRAPQEPEGDLHSSQRNDSFPELFRDLSGHAKTWAKKESELAKAELAQSADEAKSGLTRALSGVVLLLAALGFTILLATVGLALLLQLAGLATQHAYAISLLAIAILSGIIGLKLIKTAKHKLNPKHLWPSETAASLKETTSWARNKIK